MIGPAPSRSAVAERSEAGPRGSASQMEAEPCTICGEAVATDEWHPVVMDADGDASRIPVFCSAACRER